MESVRGEKRRTRTGGRAAQDRSGGRRDVKKNFQFIEFKRKAYKDFFLVELLSLRLLYDYLKGCLTTKSRTPFIAKL